MPAGSTFSDIVFLITYVLAWIGWVVSLGGVAATTAIAKTLGAALGIAWWTVFLVLLLLVTIAVTTLMGSFSSHQRTMEQYVTLITALLTVSVATASATAAGVTTGVPPLQALQAGLIILCLVFYFWMHYFGQVGQEGGGRSLGGLFRSSGNAQPTNIVIQHPSQQQTTQHVVYQQQVVQQQQQQYVAQSLSSGDDASSTHSSFLPNKGGKAQRASMDVLAQAGGEIVQARALFSYAANPNDPNELSFLKDDVLTVLDRKGKWWRVQKQDGQLGIVPSNYMDILPSSSPADVARI